MISAKVSLVLFVALSLLLFANQIRQQSQSIGQKLSIDDDFIVNAVKLGDLFFIKKYLAAFVDSEVVTGCGIKKEGDKSWLGFSPNEESAATLKESGYRPYLLSTVVFGSVDMLDPNGTVWKFYYSYKIPHFFLVYAAMASLFLSTLIFVILNKLLSGTANFFAEPVKNLHKDLDAQLANPMGRFEPQNYKLGQQFKETDRFVNELDRLLTEINVQKDKIKDAEVHKALSRLGRQVNHDIQSPLGALNIAMEQFDKNKEAATKLMKNSIQRIQDITADLKIKEEDVGNVQLNLKPLDMNSFLENLVAEKRAEYGDSVDFIFKPCLSESILSIDEAGISRALSNIINNGIEAVSEKKPQIKIEASTMRGQSSITITDNGPGVPVELKDKVLDYGFTAGKANGSGTGLSQAISAVQQHGGNLILQESELARLNQFVLTFQSKIIN
ncbi:MAG: HAMP domain-containing histidine kinase [Bdellovibrionales bacterium]|nr:HAMP domain-containing histidine kinase [Bdellovibrionales bacterium]